MRLADQMLLAQIREKVLSHIPDDQWALVESEVDKAGGVREVSGFAATLLHDAITKASFGGNRSDAGRYAAQQRWKDHVKGGGKGGKSGRGTKYPGVTTVVSDKTFSGLPKLAPRTPEQTARIVANVRALQSERKMEDIKSADLSDLAGMIVRDLRAQGKQVPAAAKPYLDAMRTMGSINENYGSDSGASIVAYLLSNLATYKGETAKAIKAELKSRLKNQKLSDMEPNPSARTGATATDIYGNTQVIQSDKPESSRRKDADSFDEDKFRGKDALRDLENNPTYKAGVAAKKSEVKRGDDGVARFRGTTLDRAREQLNTEEDSLELFESGKATSRRILGSRFNKTETRAILQARIASARATVQALEEFEDETSPGFFSS